MRRKPIQIPRPRLGWQRRTAPLGCVLFWLVACSGCQTVRWWGPAAPAAPIVLTGAPTAADIVQAVNQNSGRVQQLQSQVKVSVQNLPALSGRLAFERPNRLRLQAKLLGMAGPGVDVGSNDELFWVWMQTSMAGQTPLFLYANHQEFAATLAQQRTPIQPAWLADALGLVQIDPQAWVEGPIVRTDRNWELRVRTPSPAGDVTHVFVVDREHAWVLEQQWYDANQRPLAIARASDFVFHPGPDISLPQRIELTVAPRTADQMTLSVQLADHRINQLEGDPLQLWRMPDPQGVQTLDIGKPGAWMLTQGPVTPGPAMQSTAPATNVPNQAYTPSYRGRVYR